MKKNSIFSYGKLLQKLFLFSVFIAASSFVAQSTPPPLIGDYRSKTQTGSGPFLWTAPVNWDVYNGTGWQTSSTYPGQGTTATNQATYRVYITPGTEVTVNNSAVYYFGDLYILANNPAPNVHPSISSGAVVGRLNLSGSNSGVNLKLLGTNQNVYIYGGVLNFVSNNTDVGLLNGNSLTVRNYNGIGTPGGFGSNGLQPVDGSGCTGNKQVTFYNANGTVALRYVVCNGNNSEYNFTVVNNNGGSVSAILAASPTQLCVGQTSTLLTNYTGAVPDGKTISYSLRLNSGPAGYSFNTLSGSFTDPGTAASIPDASVGILTIPGTYIFSLTVSYLYDTTYAISSTETVTLTVNPAGAASCACYRNAAPDNSNKYPTKLGISSFGRAGANSGVSADYWPTLREGGHIAIESQTAGFVINRVPNTSAIAVPVEGMMVFDLSDGKAKIYTLKAGDTESAWHIFSTPACPTL